MDLNLLLSLDALLQERSVSRAAERLGLSQPTLSAALGRLRRHFHDDLLLRSGNQYVLTPLAERLVEQTVQALEWSDRVFENRTAFDPATADREFTLVVSDVQLPTFGRSLAELVREDAPGVRLGLHHSTAFIVLQAEEHLRTVDGLVLPQGMLAGFPSLDLYQDRCGGIRSTSGIPLICGSVVPRPAPHQRSSDPAIDHPQVRDSELRN